MRQIMSFSSVQWKYVYLSAAWPLATIRKWKGFKADEKCNYRSFYNLHEAIFRDLEIVLRV